MNQEEVVTVLVIDDDRDVREGIASYLNEQNYRVILAAGEEGLDCFHSSCPDLVLCDIDIPDGNAEQVLQNILHHVPDQPIILLVSYESTEKVTGAMRLGVSDYLLKPIANMDMLGLSIANSLKRARLIAQNNRYRKKLELINRELEEKVEIFRHDQQAGRHVQMSLLPESPLTLCGYRFAHCIIPSLYLCGDSVDYKPVSKTRVMFYIADVSGHGSSSAFVTVLLRFRIEQMRRDFIRGRYGGDFTPATLLDALNKDLLESGLDKHITLFIGMLDDEDRTLSYSVAGHYPLPILYRGEKATFLGIDRPSFPLGLTDEADYSEDKTVLDGPFTLTLFSDGILETLDMHKIEDKEAFMLRSVDQSEGDFERIKACLNLENLTNVPDDIAMMSISGR